MANAATAVQLMSVAADFTQQVWALGELPDRSFGGARRSGELRASSAVLEPPSACRSTEL